eukprot:m.135135 g.135135  ORF g.135135 m.135135 type:complete len:747 (+) comp15985_c0_seq40:128-2368(+)
MDDDDILLDGPPSDWKPLFIQWLTELKAIAQRKNSKVQHVYAKAIRSMKKYPLPLSCGSEAIKLESIGRSTAQLLDDKIQAHCSANDWLVPIASRSAAAPSNGSRKTTKRAYIPKRGSGAYALLVTLYRTSQEDGAEGYLKKADLVRLAQPLSDTSFTIPDGGSRYTAWNAMGQLTKRDLVKKYSNPAKYELTAEGRDLALKLHSANDASQLDGAQTAAASVQARSQAAAASQLLASSVSTSSLGALSVSLDLETPLLDAMPPPSTPVQASTTSKICDNCEEAAPVVRCVECDEALCDNCNNFIHQSKRKSLHQRQALKLVAKPASVVKTPTLKRISTGTQEVFSPVTHLEDLDRMAQDPDMSFESLSLSERLDVPWRQPPPKRAKQATRSSLSHSQSLPRGGDVESRHSASSTSTTTFSASRTASADTLSSSTWQPRWQLKAGEYDIVLVVDTMEQTGSRKDKGVIQTKLASMGVQCEVRKLSLGDFVWVVKERVKPMPGMLHLPPRLAYLESIIFTHEHLIAVVSYSKELVLDYVVERKRMDDLVSSIIDGRFKEQKYRFENCGIKHPIYLVEHYGNMDGYRITGSALKQAIANTQVRDNFFVKHTASINASIAYLTLMTRYLQQRFKNTTFVPRDETVASQLPDDMAVAYTFDAYNEVTVKTKELTIQEMFAQQLLTLSGITVEKLKAIVTQYPTPRSLIDALDVLGEDGVKRVLAKLSYTAKNGAVRSVGPAAGSVISKLYC